MFDQIGLAEIEKGSRMKTKKRNLKSRDTKQQGTFYILIKHEV